MATYEDLQIWIKSQYGFTIETCWIAHVKEICGLPLGKAHNRKSQTERLKPCPPDKIEPIKVAFRHFGMI